MDDKELKKTHEGFCSSLCKIIFSSPKNKIGKPYSWSIDKVFDICSIQL